jgi:hypothetical protein
MEAFQAGLKRQLRLAILRRNEQPTTLGEWRDAAIKEKGKWEVIKASGALGSNQGKNCQGKWKNALGKGQMSKKDPDAMDVDNI